MSGTASQIPAAQPFEVEEQRATRVTTPRAAWIAEKIEVVTDEPDHAVGHEPLEEVGTHLVVGGAFVSDRLSHVVEEGRGPELPVGRRAQRELEDLERVKESVAFGMVAWGLRHAIEREQKFEELVVHLP